MLYIIYGRIEEYNRLNNTEYKVLYDIDSWFNNKYTVDWLNNDFAKDVIKSVDKSNHIIDHIIDSPFLGMIPPTMLSRGVKGLLIYNSEQYKEANNDRNQVNKFQELILSGEAFGNNCTYSIAQVSNKKDIWMNLNHFLKFDNSINIKAKIVNTNTLVNTGKELNEAIIDVKYEWTNLVSNMNGVC